MQKWIKVLFMLYILLLIKLIVFKYPYEQLADIAGQWRMDTILENLGSANFRPFKTIKMYIEYSDRLNSFENIVGNIVAFIPFGMLLPLINTRMRRFYYVAANAFLFIFVIELFQLVSSFGAFDVDDIILNCFGVILGYIAYIISRSLFPAFDNMIRSEEERYGADFEKN